MIERRAFLAATATGLGAAFVAAQPADIQASLAHAARKAPLEVLTPDQAADIDAISSQILPSDDLPGAHEAGVVHFIDHALATWGAAQKDVAIAGLAAFNTAVSQRFPGTARFSLLTPAQQLEFLQANEQHAFFQQTIFMTMAGTFSHPDWGGNADKAGWRILGFEDRYLWQPPFGWYDARANGGPN